MYDSHIYLTLNFNENSDESEPNHADITDYVGIHTRSDAEDVTLEKVVSADLLLTSCTSKLHRFFKVERKNCLKQFFKSELFMIAV
jgi:hypothetical protein